MIDERRLGRQETGQLRADALDQSAFARLAQAIKPEGETVDAWAFMGVTADELSRGDPYVARQEELARRLAVSIDEVGLGIGSGLNRSASPFALGQSSVRIPSELDPSGRTSQRAWEAAIEGVVGRGTQATGALLLTGVRAPETSGALNIAQSLASPDAIPIGARLLGVIGGFDRQAGFTASDELYEESSGHATVEEGGVPFNAFFAGGRAYRWRWPIRPWTTDVNSFALLVSEVR